MRCVHNWKEVKREYYWDYSGYRVLKIKLCCKKCDKKRIKKLY